MAQPDTARIPITEDEWREIRMVAHEHPSVINTFLRISEANCSVFSPTARETDFRLGRQSLGMYIRDVVLAPMAATVPRALRTRRNPENSPPPQG